MAEIVLLVLWLRMAACAVLGLAFRRGRCRASARGAARPGVAVVIPAFNEACNIGGTLASLRSQVPPPAEIVVVDDGSTDATAVLARRSLTGFGPGRVIVLPANLGKAEALNAGIRATHCELVLTLDADTRLAPGALDAALETLEARRADAVAFHVDVDNAATWLGGLQRQEYLAALNFERAGQDVVGAISILPGAATLFRRAVLLDHPFSARTRTEDADLSLGLGRRGLRLALADGAVAATVVPASGLALVRQRVRWIAGHLQCCAVHARGPESAGRLFGLLTFPNFVMATLSLPCASVAMAAIWATGPTAVLGFTWGQAALACGVLIYVQRAGAWLLGGRRRASFACLVLEPWVTSVVATVSFAAALGWLVRARGARRVSRHPRRAG